MSKSRDHDVFQMMGFLCTKMVVTELVCLASTRFMIGSRHCTCCVDSGVIECLTMALRNNLLSKGEFFKRDYEDSHLYTSFPTMSSRNLLHK